MANERDHSKRSVRDSRLARALRDNLRRRKAQARSRAESQEADPPAKDSGPAGAADDAR